MNPFVMKTDGGPHPPEKWALKIADDVFPISDGVPPGKEIAAKEFQITLAKALVSHVQAAMRHENSKIKETDGERLHHDYEDAGKHADEVIKSIVSMSKGTLFEAQMSTASWQEAAKSVIADRLSHVMQIERSWHADRNSDHKHSKLFHAAKTHGPVEAHKGVH